MVNELSMTIGTSTPIRLLVPALLGVAAAVLVSCGGSGAGLIPTANAGPLQEDFEAVAKAAQEGSGSCTTTEAALGKTEQDFLALPASVDKALRARLGQGITNLRSRALAICAQPAPSSTTTTGTQTTTSTPQAPTETSTTSTETTTTSTTPSTPTSTATTPTSPGQGGGTEAPGESSEGDEGKGQGKAGEQSGESSGAESSSGGASPGGGR